MTPSRVRVRRVAVALATAACLLGTTLPAVAGGKDKKPPPPPSQPGPAPAPEADERRSRPAPPPAAPAPAQPGPRRQGRSRSGGDRSDRGDRGGNGNGDGGGSKAKKRDSDDDRGSSGGDAGSRGNAAPAGGDSTSGSAGSSASTPAPQPAAPQPAAPQPAPTGQSGGGVTTDEPARRRSSSGADRGGSGSAPERRSAGPGTGPAPGFAPAPVITAEPDGDAALSPLGPVGPAADGLEATVVPPERSAAGRATDFRSADRGEFPPVTQTVERIVEVVPAPIKAALLALALVALMFAIHSFSAGRRARRLARQREHLLDEVGLLQAALLPAVPARLGDLVSTVAYRPADGPAAGGDFYDAFAFDGGRVGVIVGDISGHGREALARTALMRYTLRAYLDAGLEPRAALKVAGSVLDDDLGTDFATVVVAVYDPDAGTLTYASAGHPPPILLGPPAHEPATSHSSPPVGVGATTGLRQTTVGLPHGSIACFFTDGMTDARVGGDLLGRERLAELLAELGPEVTAPELLDGVAALAERTPDDMAACILHAHGHGGGTLRVEELEVSRADLAGDSVPRFLRECGIPTSEMPQLFRDATDMAREAGTAVLRVRLGDWRPGVDVLPGNVETIAGAIRRRASVAQSS
ncbi:MAG: PP2C family protein-serine/threonine phosphatase [Thermoleophilaceae bacterium]